MKMPHGAEATLLVDRSANQAKSFDWISLIDDPEFSTADVSSFNHAPMNVFWNRLVTVGIKVEIVNNDAEETPSPKKQTNRNSKSNQADPNIKSQLQQNLNSPTTTTTNTTTTTTPTPTNITTAIKNESKTQKVYWIATVIKVCGYLAKLRYEGYEDDSSHDFWIYLFSGDVHGVGWCASQSKALVPPKNILRKLPDWTMYLIKKLTGSRTLPANFSSLIAESLKTKFKPGMKLEVVDKNRVSSVRVASVEITIGGRLLVTYDGADPEEAGFWTHERSSLVHPVGWAQFVGHELVATYEYARESLEKVNNKKFSPNDATWDMFHLPKNETGTYGERFEANMKLEAIDPLNLSSICVASVIKVLRANYLMIGMDGSMCPTGSDWFCFHATSPYIFPAGFCKANDIELTNPNNDKKFDWQKYLEETGAKAAPEKLFSKEIPKHDFKVGMMIEAVDLMQSRLVCVATITRIVGRLLRIHFNGWDESFDQWCDCESPDLFPVGWCELVGYPLEPPKTGEPEVLQQSPSDSQKKRRSSLKKLSKKKKIKTQKEPT